MAKPLQDILQDCETLEPASLHLNEQWVWKDDTNSLELISCNCSGLSSTSQNKKPIKGVPTTGHEKHSDRIVSNVLNKRYDAKLQTHPPSTAVRSTSARPSIRHANVLPNMEHDTVTMNDVKNVANCIGKTTQNSLLFKELYFCSKQLDDFLWAALNYFDAFFERKTIEEKPKPMAVEPSAAERRAIALVLVKEEEAKRSLAQCYGVLILGLGLEDAHHMHCGRKRNSASQRDREIYENLYDFVANVTWITFRRPSIEVIEKEIGRLLRSDTFNPAIRPKHIREVYAKDRLKRDGIKEPLTPAEYRRLQPKRPAIMSVVNKRSPVLSAILPTSTEAAKQCRNRKEVNSLLTMDYLKQENSLPTRVGIIGEPLSGFNPETLMAIDDETNQAEADDLINDKPPADVTIVNYQTDSSIEQE